MRKVRLDRLEDYTSEIFIDSVRDFSHYVKGGFPLPPIYVDEFNVILTTYGDYIFHSLSAFLYGNPEYGDYEITVVEVRVGSHREAKRICSALL